MKLWNENEIVIQKVNGNEVRYLNKEASQRFFDAYKELLISNGLGNLEGKLFALDDAVKICDAYPIKAKEPEEAPVVEEIPVVEELIEVEELPVIEETPVVEDPEEQKIVNKLASKIEKFLKDDLEVNLDGAVNLSEYEFDAKTLSRCIDGIFLDTYLPIDSDNCDNSISLIEKAINSVLSKPLEDKFTIGLALRYSTIRIANFSDIERKEHIHRIFKSNDPYLGLLQLKNLCKNYNILFEEYKRCIYTCLYGIYNEPMFMYQKQEIYGAVKKFSPVLYDQIMSNMEGKSLYGYTGDAYKGEPDIYDGFDFYTIENPVIEPTVEESPIIVKPSPIEEDDSEDEDTIEEEEEETFSFIRTGKFIPKVKLALYAVSGLSGLAFLYYTLHGINLVSLWKDIIKPVFGAIPTSDYTREHFNGYLTSIAALLASIGINVKLNKLKPKKEDKNEYAEDEYEDVEELDEDIDDYGRVIDEEDEYEEVDEEGYGRIHY